jgi:hypothetical protein
MYGYGRFAALSNLEEEDGEENEVDDNDVEEVVSSCGEYEAASLPVENCDATSERSLGLSLSSWSSLPLLAYRTLRRCFLVIPLQYIAARPFVASLECDITILILGRICWLDRGIALVARLACEVG